MILIKQDTKYSKELREYANETYGQVMTGVVGKDNYICYSNMSRIAKQDEYYFERRYSYGPYYLTKKNKKELFRTEDFKDFVCYIRSYGDCFEKYHDNDYLEFISNYVQDYDNTLTYAMITYVLDSDDIEKSEYYINRSIFIPIFTNEDRSVFSVIALSEYGVDIKVNELKTIISSKGISNEFNGLRNRETDL